VPNACSGFILACDVLGPRGSQFVPALAKQPRVRIRDSMAFLEVFVERPAPAKCQIINWQ
jgi:hypothetical protein